MTEIRILPQIKFENGRVIGRTNEAGQVTMQLKDGSVTGGWDIDAIVLGDKHGVSICGPLDMAAGLALAQEIIDGDARTITDPLTIYAIAACFMALADDVWTRRIGSNHQPTQLGPDQLS